jgi:hypothetical protein
MASKILEAIFKAGSFLEEPHYYLNFQSMMALLHEEELRKGGAW